MFGIASNVFWVEVLKCLKGSWGEMWECFKRYLWVDVRLLVEVFLGL